MDASSRKAFSLLLQAREMAVASMEARLRLCQLSGRRGSYGQPCPVTRGRKVSQEVGGIGVNSGLQHTGTTPETKVCINGLPGGSEVQASSS